jgi:hypothetical protein
MKKIILWIFLGFIAAIFLLSFNFNKPDKLTYGVSFSRFHSEELGLNWKEVYMAILNDLNVKHFRFSAHWPMIQPQDGKYNFSELDFQVQEAQKHGADIILAVGRRLPGWPECHEPDWAKGLELSEKQKKLTEYIETVVNRYKKYPHIIYWQVENEPYLTFFSHSACGDLDDGFLQKEIALVKSLDPTRQVIVTDSGEFGTWYRAYRRGDVFGTSLYLYVWWRNYLGPIRYPVNPGFFTFKRNLMNLIYGKKPSMIIELSSEPWLLQPIVDTPIKIQFERMGIDKFNEMLEFSPKTGFDTFYLWGAEWWYWLKLQGINEHWDRAKEVF